ncbi:Histidine kinase 4 [Hondaea fermentalgiana]|uniref:histidine kinase n=1 Tax=Hondaea fermentalgiana TaxID=2315210 RepID=A0A2R5H1P0_9STRA|nr:Histidine kinase 4 [Hondaea fermentalgiana]|eukprot:GBG34731.1 Histidine kinase 4 [Hondaea fermentalgiana]
MECQVWCPQWIALPHGQSSFTVLLYPLTSGPHYGEDKDEAIVKQVSSNIEEWTKLGPDGMVNRPMQEVLPEGICELVQEAVNFDLLPIECSTNLPARFKEQVLGQDMCDWWKDIYTMDEAQRFLKSNSTVPPLAARDMTRRLAIGDKPHVHVSAAASRRPAEGNQAKNMPGEDFRPVWSVIITLEESDADTDTFSSDYAAVEKLDRQNWQLELARDEQELATLLTEYVADFCKFDRVMYVNFLPGGHCEVVAEKATPGTPTFMNFRFPATDIPMQARALLKRNRVRHIMDTGSPGAELVPCHVDGKLTDLSNCHLRQCGPIHRQYLNNMKVFSSCTAGVMVDDMLVGMLSCHHKAKPLTMGPAKRMLLRQLCKSASSVLQAIRARRGRRLAAKIQRVLLPRFESVTQAVECLSESEGILRDTAEADALVIVSYDLDAEENVRTVRQALTFGASVDSDAIIAATHELSDVQDKELIPNTPCLRTECPNAYEAHKAAFERDRASGLAVIRLVLCDIVLVRLGVKQNVRWAGKKATTGADLTTNSRLGPRGSFQAFDERLEGVAFDWSDVQLDALSSFRAHAHVSFCDVLAADERRRTTKLTKRFLASVSHELRTPFNGIVGLLSALQEESMPDSAKDLVGTAGRSADAMLGILDDLLTAAKLDEHKVELMSNPVDIPLLVNSVYLLFERAVSKADLSLVEKVSDHANLVNKSMLGDTGRIRQILLNLLGNALKFSSQGDGKASKIKVEASIYKDPAALHEGIMRVVEQYDGLSQPLENLELSLPVDTETKSVDESKASQSSTKEATNAGTTAGSGSEDEKSVSLDPSEAVYALFTVTDEGIGIEEAAMRSKLFQKFAQLHSSGIRKKYQGTGLGLSICADLAELMGGNIWCASTLGKGSAFQFFVPLQIVEKEEDELDEASSPEEEETSTFRMLASRCGALGSCSASADSPRSLSSLVTEEDEDLDAFVREVAASQRAVIIAADDNDVNRLVINRTLKSAFPQFPNKVVDGGVPLVTLAKKLTLASCPIFAVVVDFHMPDQDGLSASTEILKADPTIGIWLYTADTSPDLQKQIEGIGLEGVIIKPSNLKTFKTLLSAPRKNLDKDDATAAASPPESPAIPTK